MTAEQFKNAELKTVKQVSNSFSVSCRTKNRMRFLARPNYNRLPLYEKLRKGHAFRKPRAGFFIFNKINDIFYNKSRIF